MADRFVFQKLACGMSRSTSRLSAQGSASSGATAAVITRASEDGTRTFSNVFHGAAIHPGTTLPSCIRGLHGRAGGGIGTLSNLFHGAAVRPGMMFSRNSEIPSGYAAMCLNTNPCSNAAAKSSCTTGVPSIMVNSMQPVFACSVSGSKRVFSCTASSTHEVSVEAKTACSKDVMVVEGEFMRRQKWLWGFTLALLCLGLSLMSYVQASEASEQAREPQVAAVPVAVGSELQVQ